MYCEVTERKEGKEVGAFYGTPGLTTPLVTLGAGPIRGGAILDPYLYVVSGASVYRVSKVWGTTLLGVMTTAWGPVSVQANPTQILFSDGVTGVMWDTSTSVFSTVASFPVGGLKLAYQDGFCLTNIPDTQSWFQSDFNDLGTWGALNFSKAIDTPTNVITLLDVHDEVWLWKVDSAEVWDNAGLTGFAFQKLSGVQPQVGCIAPFSPALIGESVMWLGQNEQGAGVVYQARGYIPIRRSTHAVEHAWRSYPTMADAIGYSYLDEGHLFYVITFPSGDATWVFDDTSGFWHERADMDANGQLHRHRSNCHFYFGGKHVVGDYQNGNLYALDLDTYTDNGNPKKWVRSWRAFESDKQQYEPWEFNRLQIDMQRGIRVPAGLPYGTGTNYLSLPGAAGDYASSPDAAPIQILGDISILGYIAASDYTPAANQQIVSKSLAVGNQRSYFVLLLTTGALRLTTSPDGAATVNADSTSALPVADGAGIWFLAYRDVDNGAAGNDTLFFTATGSSLAVPSFSSFTKLGSTVTNAGTTSIANKSAELEWGAINAGATGNFVGKIYRGQVYNGIFGAGGTLAADFNATNVVAGTTSFSTTPTSEVYTINGAAAIAGDYVPAVPSSNPLMTLRWSNDGGHNWSNDMIAKVGAIGNTAGCVNFRRLGSTSQSKGLDRVFELSSSDNCPVALIAAELDAAKA